MRRIAVVVAVCSAMLPVAALGSNPEAVLRKEAGNHFLKEKQYEKARDQYLASLQVDPDYDDAHYNLGVVYFFRLTDYPRALYHFTRYAQLQPQASDIEQVRDLAVQALLKIEEAERAAYGAALQEGTPEALRGFLEQHPQGPYAEDARTKLRLLEEYREQLRQRDAAIEASYLDALARRSPEAMERFLAAYPDSPKAVEAARLRDLWREQRETDRRDFEAALAAGTPEALERFLAEHPESPSAGQARAVAERLRTADEAYRIAADARSIPALELFLTTYADTPPAPAAEALLAELRAERRREAAESAWQEAAATDSAAAWRAFAAAQPEDPRAAEARSRAARLEAREAAWAEAQEIDTLEGYRSFAEANPEHPMAEEARRRAAVLESELAASQVAASPAQPAEVAETPVGGAGEEPEDPSLPREKRRALDRYRKMIVDE